MKKSIYLLILTTPLLSLEIPTINIQSTILNKNSLKELQTINILDENKLKTLQIDSIDNLSATVSNTNISGTGSRSDKTFTIRGISNYVAYESSIAVYVDDIPIPFSYGYGAIDFKNIKNIEVVKGPQGSAFGKNSESGVINIYTKEPTNKFENELSLGYSSYNSKDLYGFIGSPLSKDLSCAISITKSKSDGYTKNTLTDSNFDNMDLVGFSTKLLYKPSSPITIALNYSKTKIDDGGSAFKVNTKTDIRNIDNEPSNDFVKMDNDLLSLKISYQKDNYKFTSVSTYSKESILKENYVSMFGGLLLNSDIDIEEITQELKFNYNFENSDLLIGASYSEKTKFDYKEDQELLVANLNSLNSLKNPDQNAALFSNYRYYINDQYSFMAGLRYQQTKRSFNRDLNKFGASSTHTNSSSTWIDLLPTLSFSYIGNNSNTYLTYSKGCRTGGYSYRSPDNLAPFKPEFVDSFELGHKREFSSSLSISSAIFYNDIKDLRINTFDDTLASTTLNAQKAHSYGAELEATYKKEPILLYSTLGLTQTKIDEFKSYEMYQNNKIIDVPNTTASIGIKYDLFKNYYIQSDVKYMGKRYYNISNSAKQSSYSTINLGAGYSKNSLKILLYANNLFNNEYTDFMIYTPSNNYYHFGSPKVIGLTISNSF